VLKEKLLETLYWFWEPCWINNTIKNTTVGNASWFYMFTCSLILFNQVVHVSLQCHNTAIKRGQNPSYVLE